MIRYTKREEIWNAASHGGGILLGVVFGIIFLGWCFHSDNNWARWGNAVAKFSIFNYQLSINWCWSLFTFVWTCAIVGTVISLRRLKEHSNIETFCFVGMGLSILVALKPLLDSVSPAAISWIVAEGVCYITGAVFYSLNKRKYMHSVFHFFVLAGSVCHIIAVWDVLMQQL